MHWILSTDAIFLWDCRHDDIPDRVLRGARSGVYVDGKGSNSVDGIGTLWNDISRVWHGAGNRPVDLGPRYVDGDMTRGFH